MAQRFRSRFDATLMALEHVNRPDRVEMSERPIMRCGWCCHCRDRGFLSAWCEGGRARGL